MHTSDPLTWKMLDLATHHVVVTFELHPGKPNNDSWSCGHAEVISQLTIITTLPSFLKDYCFTSAASFDFNPG